MLVAELLKNKLGLKILTDTGFSDFDGLLIKSVKELLCVELNNTSIKCTLDHKIFLSDLSVKQAKDLNVGDIVYTSHGPDTVCKISSYSKEQTYDVFNVKNNHRFYANDILVKNCEFLVFDETLINSICLAGLESIEPKMNMGQVRWYRDVNPDSTFIISLDPSLGTGGDYAGIEVVELPSFHQVAEWHHNTTPIQSQVKILRDICKYINEQCKDKNTSANVYYSVENNSLGEAALVAINELGEETFPGVFLSEPAKKGHVRRFRKGFNTTHTSKIAACSKLKQLMESGTLKIYSKPLLSQLKAYIAKGLSFEAKVGEHDDLVSSLLLNIRMTLMLQDWDPRVYEKIHEYVNEELILPMPIFII